MGGQKNHGIGSSFWLLTGFPSDFPYGKLARSIGDDDFMTTAECHNLPNFQFHGSHGSQIFDALAQLRYTDSKIVAYDSLVHSTEGHKQTWEFK